MTTSTAIHYLGVREGLKQELAQSSSKGQIQVIDLVGSGLPKSGDFVKRIDPKIPTVMLSTLRSELDDNWGRMEEEMWAIVPDAVVLRLAPLDLSLPLLWGWAASTGTLMTSFHPSGPAWVSTTDLAEALTRLNADDLAYRAGKAFDITGPHRVPMARLCEEMSIHLQTPIELVSSNVEDFVEVMTGNGLPFEMAEWIASYQKTTSSPDLPTSSVLTALLGHEARLARLVPETLPIPRVSLH